MITITTLIINEMKDALGHEPSKTEMDSLSAFLATRNIKYMIDLETAINDWEHVCTHECAWCGEKFLTEEMIHMDTGEYFCCDQCKKDYKTEHGLVEETGGAECTE